MMRALTLIVLLAAVIAPHPLLAAGGQDKVPKVATRVTIEPSPARAGQAARIAIQLEPPAGITLNRYPGITFRVTGAEGLSVDVEEVFAGTKKPITDISKFAFEKIPALELKVIPKRGTRSGSVRGELKYFYCVKKSGFCAPASQELEITVPVGS